MGGHLSINSDLNETNMSDKYPLALPVNTVLAGQYIIQDVLGEGGFGITYKAVDRMSGKDVAVKEFFPESMATRVPGKTDVTTFAGDRGDNFVYGKQCFMQEAETLAKFIGNENIVRIYSYFEEYGTAYFVMDYIEGKSLDTYVKECGGKLEFSEAAEILVPIMDALAAVHEKGIVHRDVSPDNIYLTNDGKVKLIDFGAARQSLGDKSQSLDVILKHGFAPKEQYLRRGKQGPYTDIYALGATFYYVLTGKRPPDALERADEDEIILPSTLGVRISRAAEDAILMALNVQPGDRFQSMDAFKNAMLAVTKQEEKREEHVSSVSYVTEPINTPRNKDDNGRTTPIIESKTVEKKKIVKPLAVGAVVIAILAVAIIGIMSLSGSESGLKSGSIIGNSVNNLSNYSPIVQAGKLEGKRYLDMDNGGKEFRCISIIDDDVFCINSVGKAVTFKTSDTSNISGAKEVPKLSEYKNITRLYVTKDSFFVFTSDRRLYCVSRNENKVKECSFNDCDYDQFTFTESGKFCYMDWGGDKGLWTIFYTPIDEIDQMATAYYTIPDEYSGSGSLQAQLFCGDGDTIYVYLCCSDRNLNKIYGFDLSKDPKESMVQYDFNDEYCRRTFNYDGKNIISVYWESEDSDARFAVESLDLDSQKTELLYFDKQDSSGNPILYYDSLTVYPNKPGNSSIIVGPAPPDTAPNRATQIDLPM